MRIFPVSPHEDASVAALPRNQARSREVLFKGKCDWWQTPRSYPRSVLLFFIATSSVNMMACLCDFFNPLQASLLLGREPPPYSLPNSCHSPPAVSHWAKAVKRETAFSEWATPSSCSFRGHISLAMANGPPVTSTFNPNCPQSQWHGTAGWLRACVQGNDLITEHKVGLVHYGRLTAHFACITIARLPTVNHLGPIMCAQIQSCVSISEFINDKRSWGLKWWICGTAAASLSRRLLHKRRGMECAEDIFELFLISSRNWKAATEWANARRMDELAMGMNWARLGSISPWQDPRWWSENKFGLSAGLHTA